MAGTQGSRANANGGAVNAQQQINGALAAPYAQNAIQQHLEQIRTGVAGQL